MIITTDSIHYENIAKAIGRKKEEEIELYPSEMATEIDNIVTFKEGSFNGLNWSHSDFSYKINFYYKNHFYHYDSGILYSSSNNIQKGDLSYNFNENINNINAIYYKEYLILKILTSQNNYLLYTENGIDWYKNINVKDIFTYKNNLYYKNSDNALFLYNNNTKQSIKILDKVFKCIDLKEYLFIKTSTNDYYKVIYLDQKENINSYFNKIDVNDIKKIDNILFCIADQIFEPGTPVPYPGPKLLYSSNDFGKTWVYIKTWTPSNGGDIDPDQSLYNLYYHQLNNIFIISLYENTQNGILQVTYYSTDNCQTWIKQENTVIYNIIQKDELYIKISNKNLFYSFDLQTWNSCIINAQRKTYYKLYEYGGILFAIGSPIMPQPGIPNPTIIYSYDGITWYDTSILGISELRTIKNFLITDSHYYAIMTSEKEKQ